jgi:DNA-binding transcriptional ArsR family regulator
MDNPNAKDKWQGATNYSLSELMKLSPSTIRRHMLKLQELGYIDIETEKYRNTTRTRYFPTIRARAEWHVWKNQERGQIARSWVSSNWMQWYRRTIRKVYAKSGVKPMFRV